MPKTFNLIVRIAQPYTAKSAGADGLSVDSSPKIDVDRTTTFKFKSSI